MRYLLFVTLLWGFSFSLSGGRLAGLLLWNRAAEPWRPAPGGAVSAASLWLARFGTAQRLEVAR